MAEQSWTNEGTRDKPFAKAYGYGQTVLAILLPVLPLQWALLATGEGLISLTLVVLDLLALTMLGFAIYYLCRGLKYGHSELRFARFPFFLGETLEVEFSNTRGLAKINTLTLALRCIQEKEVVLYDAGDVNNLDCCELSMDSVTFQGTATYDSGGTALPFVFLLPEDGLESDLLSPPPVIGSWR